MKFKLFTLLLIALFLSVGLSSPTFATDDANKRFYILNGNANLSDFNNTGFAVTDQQLTWTTSTSFTTANIRTAQSILKTTGDYNISGVTVALGLYYQYVPRDLNQGITLRIETDSGSDTPSGTLANANLTKHLSPYEVLGGATTFTLGTSYNGQATFMFENSSQLSNNTKYWIVIVPDGGQTNWYYVQGYNTAGGYAGGTYRTSTNAGSTWAATVGDTQFLLLEKEGFNATSYSKTGQTLTMNKTWSIEVTGTAKLILNAGDKVTMQTLSANGATLLRVGYIFGGGSVDMYGNSTDHVTIELQKKTDTYYGTYPLSVYGGQAWGRYVDITGKTNGATFYNYGVYSTTDFGNSVFINNYDATASYSYYQYRSARETTFNNCTFWRNNTGASYNIYLYPTSYHSISFVDSNITTNGAYAYAVYNGEVLTSFPRFISSTYNGNELNTTHVQNIYAGGSYVIGYTVKPTIIDTNGTPIEGAYVALRPQFTGDDLNSSYMYGTDPRDSYAQAIYIFAEPPSHYATTNTEGKPLSQYGTARLWMWDAMYFTTTEKRWINYTGSNLSLRPTNTSYEWKNDGTDYGYVLTVTKPGYQGKIIYIPSNVSYFGNVTLDIVRNATPEYNGSVTGVWQNYKTSYLITSTNDFDNSTKYIDNGSYYTETHSDNPSIPEGTITIANKYGDTFEINDDDANTWKWINYELDYGTSSTFDSNISNGKYNSAVNINVDDEYADENLVLANVMLTGDFDVQVDYSDFEKDANSDGVYAGLVIADTPDWSGSTAIGIYRVYDPSLTDPHCYMATSWAGASVYTGETNDTYGKFRLTRTNGSNFSYYLWNNTENDWELLKSEIDTTSNLYVYLYNTNWAATTPSTTKISYDNFVINPGKLTTSAQTYRLQENTWTTGEIIVDSNINISEVLIYQENNDDYNYINKVDFIINNTAVAGGDWTFTTLGQYGSVMAITDAQLDYGSLANLTAPFTMNITLYKSNAYVNDKAIIIKEIEVRKQGADFIVIYANVTCGGSSVPYWVESSCSSNSTAVTNVYEIVNGSKGDLLTTDYEACEFGCDAGLCVNPISRFKYAGLVMLVMIVVIVFFIRLIKVVSSFLTQWFFILLAFLFVIFVFFLSGVSGFNLLANLPTSLSSINIGVALVFVFVLFALYTLVGLFNDLRKQSQNEQ